MNQEKLLSIVSVVMNDCSGLINTFNSIKDQLSEEIEWIVVDGNSSDGTVDFLKSLNVKYYKWISESDSGMYEAMNKGIRMSTGKYLQFLNAGDLCTMDLQLCFINKKFKEDLVFFSVDKLDEGLNIIRWKLPDSFLADLSKYASIPHQSTFIRRNVFDKVGLYSLDYKYLGDYDFFCRVFKLYNPSLAFNLGITAVSFICNGITFNYRMSIKLLKECSIIQMYYYNKINIKTRYLYIIKYLISFFPYHIKVLNFFRKITGFQQ